MLDKQLASERGALQGTLASLRQQITAAEGQVSALPDLKRQAVAL